VLEPGRVEQVEKLLAEGKYSQRQISRITGVSRGSVSAIANGTRHVYEKPEAIPEPEGPLRRCRKCGILTRMPCTECRIREQLRHAPRIRWLHDEKGPCRIELREPERSRYRQVRAWRERSPNPHFVDIPHDWPWRNREEEPGK
jgi:transcriptional regulator with XRE-family HTH domain